jgi:chemotaxis protein MotA
MLFIIGFTIVAASVIGGYMGGGGHLFVLWQPLELVIIFGSAIGAFVIANPGPVLRGAVRSLVRLFTGDKLSKKSYLDLLATLYALFKLAKSKGDLALEPHVERPEESQLLQSYPSVAKNNTAVQFLCDST